MATSPPASPPPPPGPPAESDNIVTAPVVVLGGGDPSVLPAFGLPKPVFSALFPRIPASPGRSDADASAAAARAFVWHRYNQLGARCPVTLDVTQSEVDSDSPYDPPPAAALAGIRRLSETLPLYWPLPYENPPPESPAPQPVEARS